MTISEYLVSWLKQYESIEIDTNHVSDGSDKYGLFKSPNRDIKSFISEVYEITEYYQLIARFNSVSELDRKDSDELLENLTYWADDYSINYEYPLLDSNRKVLNIKVTGSPYPISNESDDTLYQILLEITYSREREEIL